MHKSAFLVVCAFCPVGTGQNAREVCAGCKLTPRNQVTKTTQIPGGFYLAMRSAFKNHQKTGQNLVKRDFVQKPPKNRAFPDARTKTTKNRPRLQISRAAFADYDLGRSPPPPRAARSSVTVGLLPRSFNTESPHGTLPA